MKINTKYRILGIDPGTNVLGYGVIEVFEKKMFLLDIGVLTLGHTPEQAYKLKLIFERVQSLIDLHGTSELAIEAPFYGKNAQSMLKLGRAQGVAIAAGMTKGLHVTEYMPKKIKQSVTGNGNASKEQVAAMLNQIFSCSLEAKFLDATDALAAAVCHFYQSNSPMAGKSSGNSWSSFVKNNPSRTATVGKVEKIEKTKVSTFQK